jgi:alkanesulfonate monooxygenase SsuD/methylene tetrahydromethanopterin reductase-like flavin-dependent oxidoreductase (luciferase family)
VFARRAEAEGFDSVWCGDHVGHMHDGIATLGCYAGATDSITIGLNSGRLRHCGEFPGEFIATGADRRTRGAYTKEELEIITPLWRGERVTYHGRYVTLDHFRLSPPPATPPEIWFGGRSEPGDRWLSTVRRGLRGCASMSD